MSDSEMEMMDNLPSVSSGDGKGINSYLCATLVESDLLDICCKGKKERSCTKH